MSDIRALWKISAAELLVNVTQAFLEIMPAWLKDYNEDRPHGAIGHRPPILLQNLSGAASPPA